MKTPTMTTQHHRHLKLQNFQNHTHVDLYPNSNLHTLSTTNQNTANNFVIHNESDDDYDINANQKNNNDDNENTNNDTDANVDDADADDDDDDGADEHNPT